MWQSQAVEQLSQMFHKEADTRAFVLTGSLAALDVQEDIWSDVDAKIILADWALDRYYLSTAWLSPFGQLIGLERHESYLAKTLRVCLENFQRFDLTFIGESALPNSDWWDGNSFHSVFVVVWSRLPDLERQLASHSFSAKYQDISHVEIERRVDTFWFKAAQAVVKVVRNDLLIGLHLALDLARDSLVLQMIRRDQKKRTTVHRTGGWGNEIVARFSRAGEQASDVEILNFIRLSCEIFDDVALELWPSYEQRGPLLFPSIESAKQTVLHR